LLYITFAYFDFSRVLAGPFATRLLADFGAEVIKVQPLLYEAEDKFSQATTKHGTGISWVSLWM
jgi:crotonobetainyl-CoA:carnitine CoA-transferase CaiB-like acyl-CoA transferase